ncbi:hypothetical protein HYH02_010507 [Chlamydomonas schloesseri]|uniref:Uncharacterized protein n=1 Tax=Chlamydomonas schloesseri TaxID=2026947 RepID=A0A835TA46_9CHLO|nr:hypothetical protein HYH02_010507 [Chlamydomonas schloesseri]|eukprot:KAG2439877.1 hypothetical protein HYH02_010507 [Chlamydomonas schloesseri]
MSYSWHPGILASRRDPVERLATTVKESYGPLVAAFKALEKSEAKVRNRGAAPLVRNAKTVKEEKKAKDGETAAGMVLVQLMNEHITNVRLLKQMYKMHLEMPAMAFAAAAAAAAVKCAKHTEAAHSLVVMTLSKHTRVAIRQMGQNAADAKAARATEMAAVTEFAVATAQDAAAHMEMAAPGDEADEASYYCSLWLAGVLEVSA